MIKEASSETEYRATMKVLVERSGPVTTVVINRPELRNAVDAETASLLLAAFQEFEADDDAAVAVLAGAGGCFCAGWDLKSMAIDGLPDTYDPEGESALRVSRSLPSKPVIAAVDGRALLRASSVLSGKFGVFIRDGFSSSVRRATQEGRESFEVSQ